VTLPRKQVHTGHVELEGYRSKDFYIHRNWSGAVNGNVIIGGLIGMSIDFDSGSAFVLEPDPVVVLLVPDAPPPSPPPTKP
jgi:hypothetical protein